MKVCDYCGRENEEGLLACADCGTSLATEPIQAKFHCPKCGAADDFKPTVELRRSFTWWVFLTGGLEAIVFRNAGREKSVACNQCGTLFKIRTPLSRLSRVIFWLLVLPGIALLVILVLSFLVSMISK